MAGGVQRPFGRRVCTRRAGRQPRRDRVTAPSSSASGTTRLTRPQSSAWSERHGLGQQRHLGGASMPDTRRQQRRAATVQRQPDVGECQQEVGGLGRDDDVCRQRQRAADPDGTAVDGCDHRFVQQSQPQDQRMQDLSQRSKHVGGPVCATPTLALRSAPEEKPGPAPVITTHTDRRDRRPPDRRRSPTPGRIPA